MNKRAAHAEPQRISFVCTGNICRSPLAEALARHHLAEAGLSDRFVVDSFGTHDYHVGHGADRRTVATAATFGIDLSAHRARQVTAADARKADLLFAMDSGHLAFLRRLAPARAQPGPQLFLPWVDADAAVVDVPDPYYGDAAGFVAVHQMLDAAAQRLVQRCRALIDRGHV
jgi:protein-tyrosine phosphatase